LTLSGDFLFNMHTMYEGLFQYCSNVGGPGCRNDALTTKAYLPSLRLLEPFRGSIALRHVQYSTTVSMMQQLVFADSTPDCDTGTGYKGGLIQTPRTSKLNSTQQKETARSRHGICGALARAVPAFDIVEDYHGGRDDCAGCSDGVQAVEYEFLRTCCRCSEVSTLQ
jgi:hypothetical protein